MGGQQSAMLRSASSALKRSLCSGPARTFCAPPRPNKPKPRQLTIDLEPFATIRTNTEVVESYAKFGAFCVGMVALVYATSVDVSRSMRGNDMPMTADQIAQLKTRRVGTSQTTSRCRSSTRREQPGTVQVRVTVVVLTVRATGS